MKEDSIKILKDFVSKNKLKTTHIHSPKNDGEYTYLDLFKEYSELEIETSKDIYNAPSILSSFLKENISDIQLANNQTPSNLMLEIYSIKNKLEDYTTRKTNSSSIRQFSEIVKRISERTNVKTLLDVGAGEIPYSSALLAESIDKVYTMDKDFFLSDNAMKRLKIIPLKEYFSQTTSISQYDLIVGRFPCSAITPIVQNCTMRDNQIPYFVELCDCDTPSRDKGYKNGWKSTLTDIDPKCIVEGKYAFNININLPEIRQIISDCKKINDIDDNIPPKIPYKEPTL